MIEATKIGWIVLRVSGRRCKAWSEVDVQCIYPAPLLARLVGARDAAMDFLAWSPAS